MIILTALMGRLIIWTLQTTPLTDFLRRKELTRELLECDFCLGVWVFFLLSLVMGTPLFYYVQVPYIPVVSQFLHGWALSYIVHLIRLGWESKHAI